MPAFYIAPEASIRYTFTSPSGARAVLNDPTDPDFCGYLDGEDAISGIDSPEIRDSYVDLAEQDGGIGATNFYSRRPIVLNGIVIPSSVSDRNTKLGKLMAATDARFADGTLSWTPTGGEPVFVKFRRQLPFRATGGFNKKFQIGIVCNDPRIYTVSQTTVYVETNGNSTEEDYRRVTRSSGMDLSPAWRHFYLPPGTYTVTLPVMSNQGSMGMYLWTDGTNGAGNTHNVSAGVWGVVSRTFTKTTPIGTAFVVALYGSSLLTATNYFQMGNMRIKGHDGGAPADTSPFATNWNHASGYSLSFQSASPFSGDRGLANPGNAPAPERLRLSGPFSGIYATHRTGTPQVGLYPGSAYSGTDYALIHTQQRTIEKNAATSDYSALEPVYTRWGGWTPDHPAEDGLIKAYTGATTDTRLEITTRGTWL